MILRSIFVFDILTALSLLLLMEGLRNHNFIIPRPKKIIKRETPENQGKTPAFPPTSCPEPPDRGRRRLGSALRKDSIM
jgi:hypothetical protein